MHCLEASLALYALLGNEPSASRELSLPPLLAGSPLTQPLTNRATEALCWAMLAIAQVHAGQVQNSIRSGRRALALAQEIKNVWIQVISTFSLTLACWRRGPMKRRSGSCNTPWRLRGPFLRRSTSIAFSLAWGVSTKPCSSGRRHTAPSKRQ